MSEDDKIVFLDCSEFLHPVLAVTVPWRAAVLFLLDMVVNETPEQRVDITEDATSVVGSRKLHEGMWHSMPDNPEGAGDYDRVVDLACYLSAHKHNRVSFYQEDPSQGANTLFTINALTREITSTTIELPELYEIHGRQFTGHMECDFAVYIDNSVPMSGAQDEA